MLGVGTVKYVNEFMRLKCSLDLHKLQVFPNTKEITESFGAYHGAIRAIGGQQHLRRTDVDVIIAGDGCSPRTGVTFALRSAWNIISIDPLMRDQWLKDFGIRRLSVLRAKVEDMPVRRDNELIIVLPHSHAPMKEVLKNLKSKKARHIVSIPCCVPDIVKELGYPHESIEDFGIWSPKRCVHIWKNV